jgi:hypothetical protein
MVYLQKMLGFKKIHYLRKIEIELLFLLILATLVFNIFLSSSLIKSELKALNPLSFQVFLPYEAKMWLKMGFLYDYANFIKKNTPSDAVILIPPQGFPWSMTGNALYFRYFLYPRQLINGKEKEPGVDFKKENIDYVLLAWGESSISEYGFTNGWPKFFVPARRIIYQKNIQETGNLEAEIVKKDFYPDDPTNFKRWGLIEIDKERR